MSFPLNEPVLYPLNALKHGPVLVSASVQARSAEACIKKRGGEIINKKNCRTDSYHFFNFF